MDNKQLPTSSDNGRTLCAYCFLFENCSCIDEQNKTMCMAWMTRQMEEFKQGNTEIDKKLCEVSISINKWKEYQQNTAALKQNIVDLNKKLSEMSISDKESKQKLAALEKQLNAQTKMLLELKNKDRRRKQQRHSQQELAVNAAEVSKTSNANCTTIAHGDRIDNDGRLEVGKAFQGNNLDLLCSVVARDMAICFPDEQKRKASVMEYESCIEQNGSQEHVGVQPHSKRAVATKRPGIAKSSKRRWIIPGLSQEVSQWPLQPLQINGNNTNDKVTYISIGPNKTLVPQKYYESIDFTNASVATQKLFVICFDRETLATHSLSGKRSPVFKDKPFKEALDPLILDDIIFAVTIRSGVSEEEVRNTIAAVCAEQKNLWEEKNKGNLD